MEISEETLKDIKKVLKTIKEWQNSVTQRQSKQWNFDIEFDNTNFKKQNSLDLSFKVFARQNLKDSKNFSCGVEITLDGEKTRLSRYNGSSHQNDIANYECHIHHATPESISRGDRNPEHADTKVTDRYTDVDGAFKCLLEDYNIKLQNQTQRDLFEKVLS